MISNFNRIAAVGMSAAVVLMVGATTASAQKFGDTITTFEAAVEASSLAEQWLDGKLPNPKVTYDGPPITYRYASYLPAVAGVEKLNKRALEQLERESNGKIKFKQFHSQALHPQREGFTAARDNVADYTACFMIYEPTSFNLMHGLTLPFVFDDASAATRTTVELYPKYFKKEYENLGVYLGRQMITTPYNVLGNHKYETLADLKGSKIRAGGRMQSATLVALGAVPINVPSSEAYTSLQRGLVDGRGDERSCLSDLQAARGVEVPQRCELVLGQPGILHEPQILRFPAGRSEGRLFGMGAEDEPDVGATVLRTPIAARTSGRVRQEGYRTGQTERCGTRQVGKTDRAGDDRLDRRKRKGRPAGQAVPGRSEVATRDKYATMSWNDQFQQVIDNPVKGVVDLLIVLLLNRTDAGRFARHMVRTARFVRHFGGNKAIMKKVIEKLIGLVDRGTDLLHVAATCICIPLLTAIVTADVTMRYLFNAPFDWSIEFNEVLLTLILFGSLPFTTKVNGHIRMELLYRHFKGGVLRLATVLWASSGLFFSVLLAIRTANEIPFLIKINKNTEYLGIPSMDAARVRVAVRHTDGDLLLLPAVLRRA